MIICGFVALGGHLKTDEKPNNFKNAFEGTTGSAYGVVTALYNVIWSFVGYSNANYALSETRNPVRTLKIAAPTAIISVSIIYILVNIAYFAAVSKAEIIASERLVAASLFRNVMGPAAERAMSVFVALSAFGNVLSVIFSQGRLVQELGREGILPFSRLWASNRPFNAPLAGLFEHWVICVIVILAPPPGDAYNFILKYVFTSTLSVNLANQSASSLILLRSSTPLSLVVSSISTSTAQSTTGTLRSRRPFPSPSSSFSATCTW
jgi:amino acid transporter